MLTIKLRFIQMLLHKSIDCRVVRVRVLGSATRTSILLRRPLLDASGTRETVAVRTLSWVKDDHLTDRAREEVI